MLLRLLRSPVTRFLAAGAVTLVLLLLATGYAANRAANQEALSQARELNTVLANSVARPDIGKGLAQAKVGAVDRFDRSVLKRLLIDPVKRVNIWNPDGRIVYSDRTQLIGADFGLDSAHARIMRDGGTGSLVSTPGRPENAGIDDLDNTVQIFTRIRTRFGQQLLFEAYYSLDDIESRRHEIYYPFRWITVVALVGLLLFVTPILRVLTTQVASAAIERQRLLQNGLDASDAERRRIARDLHDGVVQDLAGTSFTVAAAARDPEVPDQTRELLHDANQSLRDSLKSLRSLLAEIHPPEIETGELAASLEDLIAPASAQGIGASVSVEGAETLSDENAALVWRVAQEAVRNALRHSEATTLAVTVRSDGDIVVLEVVDDGVGFDPEQPSSENRYGLRGMNSLVRDRGGNLTVRSRPGEGTTVRLEVAIDG